MHKKTQSVKTNEIRVDCVIFTDDTMKGNSKIEMNKM